LKKGCFSFPTSTTTTPITTEEALSDLPDNSVADGEAYPLSAQSTYQQMMRKGVETLHNHQATIHTEQTARIIAMVPDGGNYKDLPKELQQTRKVHIAWTRLNSKKPSITIDTGHNHHFHYQYNRVPTVRESARIQSFPDTFTFKCGKTSQLKQVGNAVPPILAQVIANRLKEML
jgi:DNA (cytosine-5)-methyltransferase 1